MKSRNPGRGRVFLPFTAMAVGLALTAGSAGAQELTDGRWMPWLGCWQAEGPLASEGPLVCVRPSGSGVEIAALADGGIATSRLLIADGQSHPVSQEGCTGWQSAQFSTDNRRVFLRSEMTCDGGAVRTASALMSMTTPSVWLDAQSIGMDGESMPRALRYRPASTELSQATGFKVPVERMSAVLEARLLASADLSLDDVAEAASRIDAVALQAFIAEHGQQFEVNADALVQLADAGIDPDVIDMIVAVSFPERFAIDREGTSADMLEQEYEADPRYNDRYYDPFGWGSWRFGAYGYGSCFGRFCNRYGYGSYFGYGYPYGNGYAYGWGYPGRPVIIEIDDEPGNGGGRVVNGRGWTRGGSSSSSGRSAQGSSSTSRPSASTVTRGSTAGRATSGGYVRPATSSGSSGSTGSRGTAKKKSGGGV